MKETESESSRKAMSEAERNLKRIMKELQPFTKPDTVKRVSPTPKWQISGGSLPFFNEDP